MKKDIPFLNVEGVYIAVAQEVSDNISWNVYIINSNDVPIDNVFVRSRGYGIKDGFPQETSVLRHVFANVEANNHMKIELIDPSVFHLNNEYWISYFIGSQIYDKKFIFVPETIIEQNLVQIPQLGLKGILHK
jgi:hypothetical protein